MTGAFVIREVVCVLLIPTQDPVKEKETEMILDYFEKFNKVCIYVYRARFTPRPCVAWV